MNISTYEQLETVFKNSTPPVDVADLFRLPIHELLYFTGWAYARLKEVSSYNIKFISEKETLRLKGLIRQRALVLMKRKGEIENFIKSNFGSDFIVDSKSRTMVVAFAFYSFVKKMSE